MVGMRSALLLARAVGTLSRARKIASERAMITVELSLRYRGRDRKKKKTLDRPGVGTGC